MPSMGPGGQSARPLINQAEFSAGLISQASVDLQTIVLTCRCFP